MRNFVALGDSITVGMGDPLPDGGWRGWAALLAPAVGLELHNFAVSGALCADVEREQLPRALELRPDLAAVVVGVNDTLRRSFDVSRIGAALAHSVGALSAAGATVLTMRLPDPGLMLRLPAALARPLSRRIQAVNAVADAVAVRFGTVHLDVARHPETYDRRMWSVDRLHPSERGHRLVAHEYATMLGVPPPTREPSSAAPTRRAQLGWMATKGTRWVVDRSRDLVPYLVGMAAAEWWYGARGVRYRLEAAADRETAVALSELVAPAEGASGSGAAPSGLRSVATREDGADSAAKRADGAVRLGPWPDPMDAHLTSFDRLR